MNLTLTPTRDQLRALLAPLDDSASHHMTWVGRDGRVHIEPVENALAYAKQHDAEMQFRLEMFLHGNGYVGP